MRKVSILGLGVMGTGMAGRLRAAGFPLTVWNRHRERARPLGGAGAVIAESPERAAADADVVITMLADDDASREVWLGASGALKAARRGSVLIECSTVTPAWIAELSRQASAKGCTFLDAPVTGSKTHAANGELVFLVGGNRGVLDEVRPVLEVMSRAIVHVGPIGSGARMKLVNNFVCGVQAAALAEAMAFIDASGLDPQAAMTVLADGAPGSPLVKGIGPRMRERDYTVNFMLALMQKDLRYAEADAAQHGVTLTTARAAGQLFERAAAAGYSQSDFAAVVEPLLPARAAS